MQNGFNKRVKFTLAFFFLIAPSIAQSGGKLSGTIADKNTQQPKAGFTVQLNPSGKSVISDSTGYFRFTNIQPGTYNVTVSGINYVTRIINNVLITSGNENTLSIELEQDIKALAGVVVSGKRNTAKAASLETPLSVQRLTAEEIKRNPGGNFDISKVIQSLPGVGGGVAGGGFRNDIIIRGGAPSENVYYLDGIEMPVINHFGTQGSGGGPQGILNANFIEEVKLSSSAFDAKYDNTLSSVLQFKQKTGNKTKTQGNVLLSATELAVTLDGPLGKNTTYLASVRRSYLQFLFQALDLPIRPNYWDYQVKITSNLNAKTTLSFMGIGAFDEFSFAAPKEATPEKLYIINSNPIINQWNYTVGANLRRLTKNGYWNLALSRNSLNNEVDKYEDNEKPTPETQTLYTNSRETESKLRFDVTNNFSGWKITYGAMLQYVDFNNDFYSVYRKELYDENGDLVQPGITIESKTATDFIKYGAFVQAGKRILNNRVAISAGIRMDANTLDNSSSNPLEQFSPRISASYALSNAINLNASVGTYYKLPSYTQLAFTQPVDNGIITNPGDYIRSTHYVAGIEYIPSPATRITVEGFYKKYDSYPVSIADGVSLANKGSDFGSIGNEPVVQSGTGRAYGFEIFAQQKLSKRFFGILSYTFYKTEFTDINGAYIPASCVNKHLLSLSWGYKFNRNWELGHHFRPQGAAPYTPFNMPASQQNYLSQGQGILDFPMFNTLRLQSFNSSDIRIDKKWFFRGFTLDVFLDITNWYAARVYGTPQYTFERNETNTGFVTTDGKPVQPDGSNAIPLILNNDEVQVTPTFGFIIEF